MNRNQNLKKLSLMRYLPRRDLDGFNSVIGTRRSRICKSINTLIYFDTNPLSSPVSSMIQPKMFFL